MDAATGDAGGDAKHGAAGAGLAEGAEDVVGGAEGAGAAGREAIELVGENVERKGKGGGRGIIGGFGVRGGRVSSVGRWGEGGDDGGIVAKARSVEVGPGTAPLRT